MRKIYYLIAGILLISLSILAGIFIRTYGLIITIALIVIGSYFIIAYFQDNKKR